MNPSSFDPNNLEHVSWRDLTGNKYNKAINPAMLNEQGYIRIFKVRTIKNPETRYCFVKFDRDYVISFLAVKVIRPLLSTSFTNISDLVFAAWERERNKP